MKKTAILALSILMALCVGMFTGVSATIGDAYPASPAAGFAAPSGANILRGELFGGGSWNNGANTFDRAFDGLESTFYDPIGRGDLGYVGMRMSAPHILVEVRVLPRVPRVESWRRFDGAEIQGSNDGTTWTTLWTSPAPNTTGTWHVIPASELQNNTGWTHFRYVNPGPDTADGDLTRAMHGDVGGVEFWGNPAAAGGTPTTAAPGTTAAAGTTAAGTTAGGGTVTAPPTGDGMMIVVIAAIFASATFFVIASRRRIKN
jgi:hypothetical protein